MPNSRPNILCFVTDQHRADHLGCYGNHQIATPNIDRLAAEGVTFDGSYVANPVCMPNRASMFTGRYPKAHRVRENGITLSREEVVLPGLLRQAGYETASIGKIHLAPFGIKRASGAEEFELCESVEFWNERKELPLPYYGLERVCYVGGHGSYAFGDYMRWLEDEHPGAPEKLLMEHAAEPPTGARQCWKAAIPEELHYNTFVADHTIDFLRHRDQSKPFFAWCSFPDPHHPYRPPRPYCDQYDPRHIDFRPVRRDGEMDDLPPHFGTAYRGEMATGGLNGDVRTVTDEHYREIIALTYGMISMVDANIGRVMAAMGELALAENTVVVFFSDHGDLMGDHWLINKGPFLYRGLVRIPTIWRMPGGQAKGVRSPDLVSTVDLCPTLLDLAGVRAPAGVQGRSYRHAVENGSGKIRDAIYIEYDESYLNDRLRQLRTKDWALTYYANNDYGLLFDLQDDPDELHNLWNSPRHQAAKRDLMLELLDETSRADDWLPARKTHA